MKSAHSCGACLVKISNLSVAYGKSAVLDNVNLELHCGQLTAVIGPNGAGKTTLIKSLLGEVPYSGEISFYDSDERAMKIPSVGYVPQSVTFDRGMPASVLDLFAAGGASLPVEERRERTRRLLGMVEGERLMHQKIGNLSGGELQRVLLAFALYPENPDLLILDEPVTGIDHSGQELFYKILKHLMSECHTSTLLVSHDFNMVLKYADNVCLLNRGVLAFGSPKEIFESPEFKSLFAF